MEESWDAENFEPKLPTTLTSANTWEGEDEEDDVKESWEDEEEEKKDEEKKEVPVAVPKKKKIQDKIAERERAEREKIQTGVKEELTPEQKLEEKLRRQKLQEESDLELAMETFVAVNLEVGDKDLSSANDGFQVKEPTAPDIIPSLSLNKRRRTAFTKSEKELIYTNFRKIYDNVSIADAFTPRKTDCMYRAADMLGVSYKSVLAVLKEYKMTGGFTEPIKSGPKSGIKKGRGKKKVETEQVDDEDSDSAPLKRKAEEPSTSSVPIIKKIKVKEDVDRKMVLEVYNRFYMENTNQDEHLRECESMLRTSEALDVPAITVNFILKDSKYKTNDNVKKKRDPGIHVIEETNANLKRKIADISNDGYGYNTLKFKEIGLVRSIYEHYTKQNTNTDGELKKAGGLKSTAEFLNTNTDVILKILETINPVTPLKVSDPLSITRVPKRKGITDSAVGKLDSFNPTTQAEFTEFADLLTKKICLYKTKDEFPTFVEDLVRNIMVQMPSGDIKRIKMTVDNMYIEKQKAEKNDKSKKPTKGKGKAKLKMEGDNAHLNQYDAYGNFDDDFDDFM